MFYSKFNNNELAKSLKTKKNLLAYIENNLTATKFSSKEEAVQILARIKAYQEIEQTKFQEVYSFIKFADISTLKLAFNNWEPTTIIYDKNSSCYFESVACSDAAREEYMMLTKMQMNGNGVFEDQSEVRGYYQATQNCCAEAYLECIKG